MAEDLKEQFKQKWAEAEKLSSQVNKLEDEMEIIYGKMTEAEQEEINDWEDNQYGDDLPEDVAFF